MLRLLEPIKQSHLKMKTFFDREMLHPNHEKYLFKTIGYKVLYIIYRYTTTAIANT